MLHQSGGPAGQSVRAIQDWCMDGRGFKDIDYNLLVDQDGVPYYGRGWLAIGSHCTGWNTRALGVCVIGTNQLSTKAMATLGRLYDLACTMKGKKLDVTVHGAHASTDCPGDKIRAWVDRGGLDARNLSLTSPRMHGEDVRLVQAIVGAEPDGIFGPITDAKVKKWQKAHNLKADGIVGPLTRAAMGL